MSWTWPWQKNSDKKELWPDIKRVPTDPAITAVIEEYRLRKEAGKTDGPLTMSFEGGGSKGIWQGGALAYLGQIGLVELVEMFGGTSVGALTGTITAKYRKDRSGQHLVDIWRGIKSNSDVYTGSLPTNVFGLLREALKGLDRRSILDNEPLRQLVHKELDGVVFDVPVYTVAVDYTTGVMMIMGPGTDAATMAISSASVPIAFDLYNNMFDGGTVMNSCAPYFYKLGTRRHVALYCGEDPSKIPAKKDPPNIINIGKAALEALFSTQELRAYDTLELENKIRILEGKTPISLKHLYPSAPTGDVLEFGVNHEVLQHGYDDAVRYVTADWLKELLLS